MLLPPAPFLTGARPVWVYQVALELVQVASVFSSWPRQAHLVARATRPHSPEQHAARRHDPSTMSAQPARPKEF
jgi:hypothetical protein